MVRLIGNPKKRYQEDPVRMLRAIRFMAKLGFTLDPKTAKPIRHLAHLLRDISHSRLFHEVIKLYHSGQAVLTHRLLNEYNLFEPLFPSAFAVSQVNKKALSFINKALHNTDQRITNGQPITPAFLYAVLLWHPVQQKIDTLMAKKMSYVTALEQASKTILSQQNTITSIPKYYMQTIRDIWMLQPQLKRRHVKHIDSILNHVRFRAAYDFLVLRSRNHEAPSTLVAWWTTVQSADKATQEKMLRELPPPRRRRRKRHKR